MEDEESSGSEDEPPNLWYLLVLLCLLLCIPLFAFYPFKTLLGLFLIYSTYVGYSEDRKKTKLREKKRKQRRS